MRRPASVMRPWASSAPSSASSAVAAASAPGRRRIEERQIGGRRSPGGAIQRQARQFRLQDLRPVVRGQAAMQRRGPQPDRDPRRLAPGPPGPLLGRRAGNAQRRQPGQAGGGIEPRRPAPAAVHHDAHAGHGQRGLGDRGRQHHPPPLGRPQRAILLGRRQIAVQRQHQRAAALERRLGAADLRHAGQERQDVAVMRRQRGAHGAGHRLGQFARPGDVAGGVADLDREHVPAALDRLRVQQSGKAGDLGGRRHRDQPQLRAQHTLQVEAQRQRQVGFHRALVHLVQDHGGDALQPRIGLQPTDQQALGDDLDAGRRARRRHPAWCGSRPCRRRSRRAAPPCGWRRRGWRAGAAPASGWCRRRATAHRAARAAPASSCRRPAVPTAPRCARPRARRATTGWHG